MNDNAIVMAVELRPEEAEARAQFFKCMQFVDYMDKSTARTNEAETRSMQSAGEKMRKGLAAAGFDPR